MTLLATGEAFAAFRQMEYDPLDDMAILTLEAASGAVRDYCDQTFDLVVDDVVDMHGSGTTKLLLPELPARDVIEVSDVDTDDTETTYAETDYHLGNAGILHRVDGGVWPYGVVRVTYTHGYVLPGFDAPAAPNPPAYPLLPAEIQLAVMQIAARGYATVGGGSAGTIQAEAIGTYSVTYAGEGSGTSALMAGELMVLDRYRVQRVA